MKKMIYIILCMVACFNSLLAEENEHIDAYGDFFGMYDFYGGERSYLIKSYFVQDGLYYTYLGIAPGQIGVMAPGATIRMVEPSLYDFGYNEPHFLAEFENMPGNHASGDIEIPEAHALPMPWEGMGENSSSVFFVTRIMMGAFANCHGLTSVTLPGSLMEIRAGAFANCENLVTVDSRYIAPNFTVIYPWAFKSCKSLKKIDLTFVKQTNPHGGHVFEDCPNLEEIIMTAEHDEFRMLTGRSSSSLKIIRLKTLSPKPPRSSVTPGTFTKLEYHTAKLIVPNGSKELYQNLEPWCNFVNIYTEDEYAAVENITTGTEVVNVDGCRVSLIDMDSSAEVYEISGLKVATLNADNPEFTASFPGIFIINSGRNSQKVVLQ